MFQHQGSNTSRPVFANILLDLGSEVSLVDEVFVNSNQFSTTKHASREIKAVGNHPVNTEKIINISLSGVHVNKRPISITAAVARLDMCVSRHFAFPERHFPSLSSYYDQIIPVASMDGEMIQCNIILGCLHMFQFFNGYPISPSEPGSNSFVLLSTSFGLVPAGAINLDRENFHYSNLVAAITDTSRKNKASENLTDFSENSAKTLDEKIEHWLSIESLGIKEPPSANRTANQIRFCENLKKTLHKDRDGIFTIGLIKNSKLQPTPCNYNAVKAQTVKISKQLQNSGIKDQYDLSISKLLDADFLIQEKDPGIQKAVSQNLSYILLAPVSKINIDGTTKVRIVLSAAMKYNGVSLNDRLASPPRQSLDMLKILLGVRMHEYMIAVDIANFYMTLRLHPEDTNCLCSFFLDNQGNLSQLRFRHLPFGIQQSSYLSAQVLHFLLYSQLNNFSSWKEALDSLDPQLDQLGLHGADLQISSKKDSLPHHFASMYVKSLWQDDALLSFKTEEELINFWHVINALLSPTFKLAKVQTNSTKARKEIPKDSQLLDENQKYPLETSLLGLPFNIKSDLIGFKFSFDTSIFDTPNFLADRKTVFSCAGSLLDYLGVLSPFLVEIKLIAKLAHAEYANLTSIDPKLKKLSVKGQWRVKLSKEITKRLSAWAKQADLVHELTFPRLLGLDSSRYSICFVIAADASATMIGTVLHVVLTNKSDGKKQVKFVMARNKTYDKSKLTIARAELTACQLAAKLLSSVLRCLQLPPETYEVMGLTDSMIALCWMRSDPDELKIYCGNRVKYINSLIPFQRWAFIPGIQNLADATTRYNPITDFLDNRTKFDNWISPSIYLDLSQFKLGEVEASLKEEYLIEFKPHIPNKKSYDHIIISSPLWIANLMIQKGDHTVDKLLLHHSDLNTVLNIVAYCLRWKSMDVERTIKPSQAEKFKALLCLVKRSQELYFMEELQLLRVERDVTKNSKIFKLSPFLDEDQIIRSNSRLACNEDPTLEDFPIILDGRSTLARMYVQMTHKLTAHTGRSTLIFHVRKHFYITKLVKLCDMIVSKCTVCAKHRKKQQTQMLGNVHEKFIPNPLSSPVQVFKYIAYDHLGQYAIKNGTRTKKIFVLAIACMISRYIRFVIIPSVTAESIFLALETHMALYRRAETVFTDRFSSYLVVNEFYSEMFLQLNRKLQNMGTRLKFADHTVDADYKFESFYKSPNHALESIISIMKKSLSLAFLKDIHLTREEFEYRLALAEQVTNSRPLRMQSESSMNSEDLYVSPRELLLGSQGAHTLLPFVNEVQIPENSSMLSLSQLYKQQLQARDRYARKFISLYVADKVHRGYWVKPTKNIEIGSIVIVKPTNRLAKRSWWNRAKVIDRTINPTDGLARNYTLQCPNGSIISRNVNDLILIARKDLLQDGIQDLN